LEKEFNKLLEATSYLSHNLGEFLNIFRHNPIGYLFSFCFLLKILIQRLKISLFLSVMLLNWLLSRLFFFIIWDFDKEKIKIKLIRLQEKHIKKKQVEYYKNLVHLQKKLKETIDKVIIFLSFYSNKNIKLNRFN